MLIQVWTKRAYTCSMWTKGGRRRKAQTEDDWPNKNKTHPRGHNPEQIPKLANPPNVQGPQKQILSCRQCRPHKTYKPLQTVRLKRQTVNITRWKRQTVCLKSRLCKQKSSTWPDAINVKKCPAHAEVRWRRKATLLWRRAKKFF